MDEITDVDRFLEDFWARQFYNCTALEPEFVVALNANRAALYMTDKDLLKPDDAALATPPAEE